jgi:hypothetical protein
MSGGFVKLYGSLLLGSSLMEEAVETRWLFICLAVAADEHGFVRCQTVGNAARLANLTHDQAAKALEALSSPDPDSTTPDEDGRRIVAAVGGWRIVNHTKYREMRTDAQVKKTERQKRWREGHKASTGDAVDARETEVSASLSVVVPLEGGGGGDPRPPEAQVRGSNFREASDLEIKILRVVRQISQRTGKPAWEVCRKVTSYKRRDGEMSAGVEDPSRLGSILARQKALEDAEWWLGELDKEADGGKAR